MKLTLQVVDRYLKPDGVFYEVLSEDRDGVGAFVESIQRLGFIVEVMDAPEKFYRNFNTRSWSKQVRTFTHLSSSRQSPSIGCLAISDICLSKTQLPTPLAFHS